MPGPMSLNHYTALKCRPGKGQLNVISMALFVLNELVDVRKNMLNINYVI